MPIAPSTPLIGAPIAIPDRTPLIRIPQLAPPKPDARRDIHANLRPRSTPSVRTTPPCLSLGRGQSKSDAERQDESGDQCFHAPQTRGARVSFHVQPYFTLMLRAENVIQLLTWRAKHRRSSAAVAGWSHLRPNTDAMWKQPTS